MKNIRLIFLFSFFFLGIGALFCTPAPPPSAGPNCWPPPCVPIDGGLSLIMAAGAAYGARKIYLSSKNNKVSL